MKRNLICGLAMVLGFSLELFAAPADDGMEPNKLPPVASRSGVTYARDIKPIFDKSCVKCHGADKPKGRLRLDSLAAALKGGKNGKDILPGKSSKSPLVYAVARGGDDDESFMPPPEERSKIAPLTREQVGLIRAWIDQGAK